MLVPISALPMALETGVASQCCLAVSTRTALSFEEGVENITLTLTFLGGFLSKDLLKLKVYDLNGDRGLGASIFLFFRGHNLLLQLS